MPIPRARPFPPPRRPLAARVLTLALATLAGAAAGAVTFAAAVVSMGA